MEKSTNNTYQLFIHDLRLWVHLGCDEYEKHRPQEVSIDIELNFKTPPKAMVSDRIEETICYGEIIESLKIKCHAKQFNLVEFLAQEILSDIKKSLDKKKNLKDVYVSVKKISPPIPLVGNVGFSCRECI